MRRPDRALVRRCTGRPLCRGALVACALSLRRKGVCTSLLCTPAAFVRHSHGSEDRAATPLHLHHSSPRPRLARLTALCPPSQRPDNHSVPTPASVQASMDAYDVTRAEPYEATDDGAKWRLKTYGWGPSALNDITHENWTDFDPDECVGFCVRHHASPRVRSRATLSPYAPCWACGCSSHHISVAARRMSGCAGRGAERSARDGPLLAYPPLRSPLSQGTSL